MELLFVHGALVRDGDWWWHRTAELLLERTGVASRAVALPSCGESAADRAGAGLVEDAAALRAALDDIEDDEAIVVGHSYGGTVIAEAGAHAAVARLVYISSYLPDIGSAQGGIMAGETDRLDRARRRRHARRRRLRRRLVRPPLPSGRRRDDPAGRLGARHDSVDRRLHHPDLRRRLAGRRVHVPGLHRGRQHLGRPPARPRRARHPLDRPADRPPPLPLPTRPRRRRARGDPAVLAARIRPPETKRTSPTEPPDDQTVVTRPSPGRPRPSAPRR